MARDTEITFGSGGSRERQQWAMMGAHALRCNNEHDNDDGEKFVIVAKT